MSSVNLTTYGSTRHESKATMILLTLGLRFRRGLCRFRFESTKFKPKASDRPSEVRGVGHLTDDPGKISF